jgi:cytoskeletal protein RodZ
VEAENQQLSDQSKKGNAGSKDKGNFGSNSSLKSDKAQSQTQNQSGSKERKVRNPPYEARPSAVSKSEVPPRFQRHQQGPQQGQQYSGPNKATDPSVPPTKGLCSTNH